MSESDVKETLEAGELPSEITEISDIKEPETKPATASEDMDVSKVKDESEVQYVCDVKHVSEVKPDSEIKQSEDLAPKPQRRPRINRRSYVVDSNLCSTLTNERKESKESRNGCDAGSDKKKVDPPARRIISLNTRKSTTSKTSALDKEKDSPSTVQLKRQIKSPITFDLDKKETIGNVISNSAEPAPKKKHKPITWP